MQQDAILTARFGALIDQSLAEHTRANEQSENRYWYPLAMATYGTEEILQALDSLCSFRTTMWEKTRRFEDAFGEKFGGEAVMVNSGSSADLLVAFGLNSQSGGPLKHGDEILVPAVTWPTQVWSLLMAGYRVRLVDVDPETLNVDLEQLTNAIGPETRAISLVHLMGNPVDMDRLRAICATHDLLLFEDCCESLGAKWGGQYVGTFGLAGTFSFFFSHHITTMEGGMILTKDAEFAERLRLLRAHGWSRNLRNPPPAESGIDPRYTFLNWGFNVRPTELQSGFGLVQLARFDEFQAHRDRNAAQAVERLQEHADFLHLMHVPAPGTCSWFALPVLVDEQAPFTRDEITGYLERHGVETRPIVTGNIAKHPAVRGFEKVMSFGALPGADAVHERGFYLGLHPVDGTDDLDRVFALLDRFVGDARASSPL